MTRRKWLLLLLVLLVLSGLGVYVVAKSVMQPVTERKYRFFWLADEQNITSGHLVLEAVFNWETENLSIKVTVNDDDYGNDRLGLVFDRNHDGVLEWNSTPTEWGYCLTYWNSSWNNAELAKTGAVITPKCAPDYPSPYHTCIYKENIGYTFNISIPKKEINFETPMLVHISFYEESFIYMMPVFVWKQFKVQ